MSKTRAAKKVTVKARKQTKASRAETIADQAIEIARAEVERTPREALCVFAFRLTAKERDAIHKAAGPAKASKFARTLLAAAARNDEAAVKAIMKGIQADA